jgi:DNA polymerase-4
MKLLEKLWRDRPEPRCQLLKVGVVLTRLCEHGNYTPELFQVATDALPALDTEKHQRLDATLDKLRARYGRSVVYYGNVQENRDDAPMRISFTHIPDLEVEQD